MQLARDRATAIGPRHVETETGAQHPADVVVYATGFLTQEWLFPMEIRGEGGRDLHEVWRAAGGAEAYKGTVVAGFPNLFVLYGPNAATGQHSVIFHSECQINYACRLLRPVLKEGARSIMVKSEAQAKDLAWVHEKLKGLVFNAGCSSWWMDPKTKKNTFIYPDPMYKYWLRTIFPRWSDFEIRRDPRFRRNSTWRMLFELVASAGMTALAWIWLGESWQQTLKHVMSFKVLDSVVQMS